MHSTRKQKQNYQNFTDFFTTSARSYYSTTASTCRELELVKNSVLHNNGIKPGEEWVTLRSTHRCMHTHTHTGMLTHIHACAHAHTYTGVHTQNNMVEEDHEHTKHT